MISITIEAENAAQAREEMRALLGQDRETEAPEQQIEEKPAPKRQPRKSAEPSAKNADVQSDDTKTDTGEETSASSVAGATTTSPSDEPLDPAEIKKRGFRYAQKAGAPAATEMITQAGAENGKFEELDEAGLQRLSNALAEAGY